MHLGPDVATFERANQEELHPVYLDKGMAFMFETPYFLKTTAYARTGSLRQMDYQLSAWNGFKSLAKM
jgi:homogentisate 1,2-dioxygenase